MYLLRDLDRFFSLKGLQTHDLPEAIVVEWLCKRQRLTPKSHRVHLWIIRELSRFIASRGYNAYTPASKIVSNPLDFTSAIAPIIEEFIAQKKAVGYRYECEHRQLYNFDRFLREKGLSSRALPRHLVMEWTGKRPDEAPRTHHFRFGIVQRLAAFMARRGYDVYVPDAKLKPLAQSNFAPYIFTHEEIRRFIASADFLPTSSASLLRHVVVPELFRILYCCGLRIGEAVRLTLADTDLEQGILTIKESKFHKDRLVPLSPEVNQRLKRLQERLGKREPAAPLFPRQDGKPYSASSIYKNFRDILQRSGILHRGKGKGPRLHDLRHTFACHAMEKWYRDGADLNNKLPVLAAYMGHRWLLGTQQYLHLTLELSAELSCRLDKTYGYVIPERAGQ